MDHASSDPLLASAPPAAGVARPTELASEHLARIFGTVDLPDRLAAVEQKITASLAGDGALLGPTSLRVAAAGGKRLRPLFTIVSASIGDVFDDRVIAAAAAVELVQVGSLVHDDILDDAATRRGRPTINAVEGVNRAVLAGDYILARAAQLAASVSGEAARLLAATLAELCEGQVLEMRDAFDPHRSLDAYLASIRGKTAALFECACRLGAQCAGLPSRTEDALARFGDAFGMSFQVLDDVLDLIGDPDQLGKPTGLDVASGIYTLPVLTALQGPDGDRLRRLLTGPLAEHDAPSPDGARTTRRLDVVQAVDLVRASGSIAAGLATMDRYADDARRAVAHLNQTRVGEGLAAFPRTYGTWALENLMDQRFLEIPLTAHG